MHNNSSGVRGRIQQRLLGTHAEQAVLQHLLRPADIGAEAFAVQVPAALELALARQPPLLTLAHDPALLGEQREQLAAGHVETPRQRRSRQVLLSPRHRFQAPSCPQFLWISLRISS